jgi:NADPH-dependent 2,4-dienoyl-CoA reductase/sulfur reductase-like enzyme
VANPEGGYAVGAPQAFEVVTAGPTTFVELGDTMFRSGFEVRSYHAVDPWARLVQDEKQFAREHDARRAVVAGAGLLGLEVAYSLHQLGLAVTVLERSERLLRRHVDGTCSALLDRYLEELGIQVVTAAEAAEVTGQGLIEAVTLTDGRVLEADLLVVCAGIRPEVELARAAGIDVGVGVLVDDRMRTSAPDVYAAGTSPSSRAASQDSGRSPSTRPGWPRSMPPAGRSVTVPARPP